MVVITYPCKDVVSSVSKMKFQCHKPYKIMLIEDKTTANGPITYKYSELHMICAEGSHISSYS